MFRIVLVKRGQRFVHLVDGVARAVLGPGRHFVWTIGGMHEFVRITVDVNTALTPLSSTDPVPPETRGATIIAVQSHERVAVLLDGALVGCLGPGRYRWWDDLGTPDLRRSDLRVPPEPVAIDDPLQSNVDKWFSMHSYTGPVLWTVGNRARRIMPAGRYRWWLSSPWSMVAAPRDVVALGAEDLEPLPDGARIVSVGRDERVVAHLDGALLKTLGPGRYLWWEPVGKLELRRYSLIEEPAPLPQDDVVAAGQGQEEVAGSELQPVVLLRDGLPVRALPPGRYRAWSGSRWGLKSVPLSLQSLDVAPQDLLTEDQVPVRLKAAVSVRVVDPVQVLSQPDWPNQVYTAVQLAMREVVSSRALEPLLTDRGPAAEELLARARALLPNVGISVEAASIKDVILPGEVKDLLNRVTLARKEAEALAIRRREETAQTRQLANTARLLENNPVLLRLKELESLGELAARIERITLVGSGDLVKSVLLSNLGDAPQSETSGPPRSDGL